MNDAERIWMEVAGRAPTAVDAMSVAAVEAIVLESRTKVDIEDKVRRLVVHHLRAVQSLHDLFGIDAKYLGLEGDCECQCHTWSETE